MNSEKEVIAVDVPEVIMKKLEDMQIEEGFDNIEDVVVFMIRYYFDNTGPFSKKLSSADGTISTDKD